MRLSFVCVVLCAASLSAADRGIVLGDLTWQEAERVLKPETVVAVPLGAESKEHGPHLKLKNDSLIADYLRRRVLAASDVVMAPTINYSFYPAFVEYPGATSVRLETARDMIVDICRGLARFGPKRFYVINTGVSTLRALQPAAELLAQEGILLRFTDLGVTKPVEDKLRQGPGGTHAEEFETSMMLYIAPQTVDMKKAVRDFHGTQPGGLTRDPNGGGLYSPSGVWGDATLATREKGKAVTEALVSAVLRQIEELRSAPLPAATR